MAKVMIMLKAAFQSHSFGIYKITKRTFSTILIRQEILRERIHQMKEFKAEKAKIIEY